MEKRRLIRTSPKGSGFYTARIWRITQGALKAETGMLRVRLYFKGKLVPHSRMLCRDTPAAECVVIRWTKHHAYFINDNIYTHGMAPMIAGDNGALIWTAEGWK